MSFDFKGILFLVTGASRGLGWDLSKAIAAAGGEVYALARDKDSLDNLVKESERIHPILADLNDWEGTRAELEKLEALDGVVNNAAVSFPAGNGLEVSKEIIENTFRVNVMGAINVIQMTAKKMIDAKKRGSIVNVSSMNAVCAMKNVLAYDVSKAALDMVTKQYAVELGPHQIRVNSVNPTVLLTDMGREHWRDPARADRLKSLTPMGRFCEVHECVGPIMYLLSDLSTMVNGAAHPIEGGLLSNIAV